MSATSFQRMRREQELKAKMLKEQAKQEAPFDKMKVDELKGLAKEKGIDGYDNMKKADLIEALKG